MSSLAAAVLPFASTQVQHCAQMHGEIHTTETATHTTSSYGSFYTFLMHTDSIIWIWAYKMRLMSKKDNSNTKISDYYVLHKKINRKRNISAHIL